VLLSYLASLVLPLIDYIKYAYAAKAGQRGQRKNGRFTPHFNASISARKDPEITQPPHDFIEGVNL